MLIRARNRCECRGECGRTHDAFCVCFMDECECEHGRCFEVNYTPADSFRGSVLLTVAHRDRDPTHNDMDNLAAMCQGCHNRYDHEHRMGTAATTRHERKASGDLFT